MGVIGSSEMMLFASGDCTSGCGIAGREQQAAREQDANHRDPAPMVGEPSHTASSA